MLHKATTWMHRLLCALLCVAPAVGSAGSLGVGPTLIELDNRRVSVLNVRNTGSAPTIVQLETMAWGQDDGSDNYTPTDEIIASPEVFELQPGELREVRIGARSGARPATERSYRVYVREVPQPAVAETPQLQFVVRIGVPVFVGSPAVADQQLHWELQPAQDGCARLALHNASSRRQRIHQLELLGAEGVVWNHAMPVYVLAGATRIIQPGPCGNQDAATALRITGETHTEVLSAAH